MNLTLPQTSIKNGQNQHFSVLFQFSIKKIEGDFNGVKQDMENCRQFIMNIDMICTKQYTGIFISEKLHKQSVYTLVSFPPIHSHLIHPKSS